MTRIERAAARDRARGWVGGAAASALHRPCGVREGPSGWTRPRGLSRATAQRDRSSYATTARVAGWVEPPPAPCTILSGVREGPSG